MLDGIPSVGPAPVLPPPTELGRYAGRWIDRKGGATADIALRDDGMLTVTTYGVPFTACANEDGRLGNRTYSTPFTFRLLGEGGKLEVEQDAGATATYHRVAEGAALPDGLSGRYVNDDMAASWTIEGTSLTVIGPLRVGTRWSVEPIEGDVIRVVAPTALFAAWLDGRVLRERGGRITGLALDGGRARRLVFRRAD